MTTLFTGPLLDSLVSELIPDHVQGNYPKYVEFIRAIAKFLEEESKAGYMINRVARQRDIDLVDEEFLTELQNEIGSAVPRAFAANPRLFYRKLGDLYRSRGTPGSIEAFFRLLYNDSVELYFPKDDIFKPSDGTWFDQVEEIKANVNNYDPQFSFLGVNGVSDYFGNDISAEYLKYNKPVVFIDNVYSEDWSPSVVVDGTGTKLEYHIILDTPAVGGETIDIYEGGLFSTTRSMVSNDKKLQDSFFYQKFSYVLRTGTDAGLWRNAYNRLIHPAGFIFFSEILILIDFLGGIFPLEQPGWQTYGAPILLIPVNNPVPSSNYISTTEMYMIIEPVQVNAFGPAQYLEQIKFSLNGGMGGFGEFTIEQAIELELPFNMDAQIEIS